MLFHIFKRITSHTVAVSLIYISLGVAVAQTSAVPVGNAFTYQGLLKHGNAPVNGLADLQFTLFDAAEGGSAVSASVTQSNVSLSDGLFTTELDFGSSAFGSQARWMNIAVRFPAGSGSFVSLSPRQRVRPAPLAQYAMNVDGSTITNLNASNIATGTVPSSAFTGNYSGSLNFSNAANIFSGAQFTGGGSGLHSLNAANISSGILAIARGGTGASSASAALTNLNAQARVTGTAPVGQYIRAINSDGTVTTGVDADTTYLAGSGLQLAGTVFSVASNGINNVMLANDSASLNKVSGGVMTVTGTRIGINTTPIFEFDVARSATNNINPVALFRQIGSGSVGSIRLQNGAGNHFNVGTTASNQFAIGYNANISLADLFTLTSTGNLGLGTNNPASRLHVDGSTTLDGTVTLGAVPSIPTTARTQSIPPSAFNPTVDGLSFAKSMVGVRGTTAGQGVEFSAPVMLPQDATITSIDVYLLDSDATQNISISFLSRLHTSTTSTTHASGNTVGSPGTTTVVLAGPVVVDNSARCYELRAFWTTPATPANCRIMSVRVNYTITSPLP